MTATLEAQLDAHLAATERRTFQFMPALSEDEYARLKADIAEHGVEVPAVLDEHGTVIDGHHRMRICCELGIDCPSVVHAGLTEAQKRLMAARLNLNRRHLTDAQRAMLGRMLEPDLAEQARERKAQGGRGGLAEDSDKCRTVDSVARFVGLGIGRTYERLRDMLVEIEERDPQAYTSLERGELSVRQYRKAQAEAQRSSRPAVVLPANGDADAEWDDSGVGERLTFVRATVVLNYRVRNPVWRDRDGRDYRRESKVDGRRVIQVTHDGEPDAADAPSAIGLSVGRAVQASLRSDPLR